MEEVFFAVFPTYLEMGMSFDEFWHGRPKLAECYRQADENRRKTKYWDQWTQGLYVALAISSCLSGDGKYPEGPIQKSMQPTEEELARKRMIANKAAIEKAMARIREQEEVSPEFD